jgi:hypothetical protein
MEQERFDQLARGLAAGFSRRGMVRNLAGAAVGGILLAAGTGAAGATTRQRSGRKDRNRAGVSASRKKRRCKSPNTKCGKGKKAPCCTCQQDCSGNSCVPKSETVRVRFVPFSGDSNFCTIWVDVTGFADGPYTANVATGGRQYPVPITVTSGTGSGIVDGGTLFQNNATSGSHNTVLATLEGVCSDTVPLTCAAT